MQSALSPGLALQRRQRNPVTACLPAALRRVSWQRNALAASVVSSVSLRRAAPRRRPVGVAAGAEDGVPLLLLPTDSSDVTISVMFSLSAGLLVLLTAGVAYLTYCDWADKQEEARNYEA